MEVEKPRMFPRSIVFILLYAMFERYASYGVISIMAVFLTTKLNFSETVATEIFHYFFFAAYGFGILGAIIADNWLGRFKTLLFGMSFIGGIGTIFLIIGTVETLSVLLRSFTIIAFILITFGLGCLEPNLPAFSGDQYKLPLEAKGFSLCFGLLFFVQNVSRIFAAAISPIIRKNTSCFGAEECYPLLYGIFLLAKFVAIVLIVAGKKSSVRIKPKKIFAKFCGCIKTALTLKMSSKTKVKRDHWLDYSIEEYGTIFVNDAKRIMSIFSLLPMLILNSSLYFQQSSRWVFQANLMNRKIGNLEIEPDQVQVVNAISVIILVFVCEYLLNPLMERISIRTHLHRVSVGIFASILAFVCAAILQFQINRAGHGNIHVVWMIPQYFLLALGEVLVYVQFTQFCYREAPIQMKSILQATFAVVIGCGNLIVALIASVEFFKEIAYEFLLFAGIVTIALFAFIYLSAKYDYVKEDAKITEDDVDGGDDNLVVQEIVEENKKYSTRL